MLSFLTDLFKPQAAKPAPITSETSMNFDVIEVAPFLTRLTNHPRFGLPMALPGEVAVGVADLDLDQSRRWQVEGEFDGAPILLEIEAVMDDVDAPDLIFFSSAAVTQEIDIELTAFDQAREAQ